ncbi:MAG: hypothetical protein ACOY0T_37290 [Myxococcota bacterium]
MKRSNPRLTPCDPAELAHSARITTALSHLGNGRDHESSGKARLARLWLSSFASMAFLSGCIVADPPQYRDPERTPPILNLAHATPPMNSVIVIDRTDTLIVNDKVMVEVPMRSDDLGEQLYAVLHLDYTFDSSEVLDVQRVPAGTLSDPERTIRVQRDLITDPGCHTLTLLVAHESSFDNAFLLLPEAQNDTAVATWWMNIIEVPGQDPYTLVDCPNLTEVQTGR